MQNSPLFEMINRSGMEGKTILLVLGAFSLLSWAIILNRYLLFYRTRKKNSLLKKKFAATETLNALTVTRYNEKTSMTGRIASVAISELHRITSVISSNPVVTDKPFFVQSHLTIASERLESDLVSMVMPLEKGLPFLAMISSLAPFLGLLGTVWGIMNAFFEIGKQGSASLSVVAPGVAEALITTIVGLGVAIPALFFYNYLNHSAEHIVKQLEGFKDKILLKLKCEILDVLYQSSSAPVTNNAIEKSFS